MGSNQGRIRELIRTKSGSNKDTIGILIHIWEEIGK